MKHLIVLFLTLLFLSSCDNELNLTTEWKNIPIVYGLLNEEDQVQYIRIEKAFLDPTTNAFELAQNVDSIYYSNALVQLERPKFNETINLEKVDASKEGLVRAEGVFPSEPNFLYKIDLSNSNPLEGGEELILSIIDNDQVLGSSETTLVESFFLISGQPGDDLNFGNYDRVTRISWRPIGTEASIYDVSLKVNYQESLIDNASEFVDKSITWVVAKNLVRENTERMGIEIQGEDFYAFLGSVLEPAPNQIRIFQDIDVTVTAGGRELANFIRVRQANTGLTSSQVTPTFSNIENGLGLFSSTAKVGKQEIGLDFEALDSLANGFHTKDLSFEEP